MIFIRRNFSTNLCKSLNSISAPKKNCKLTPKFIRQPRSINNLFAPVRSVPILKVLQTQRYFSSRRNKTPRTPNTIEHFHITQLPQSTIVPDFYPHVPVIATEKTLIFPRFTKTIEITDPQLLQIIRRQIVQHQPYAGIFLKRSEANSVEVVEDLDDIYDIGSFVHIKEMKDYGNKMSLMVKAIRRVRIINQLVEIDSEENEIDTTDDVTSSPVFMVEVDNVIHHEFMQTDDVKASTQEIVKTFREIVSTNSLSADLLHQILQENQYMVRDTVYLCDLGASITSASPAELQAVLAEEDIPKRLLITLALLKKELQMTNIQLQIGKEVEANIKQMHRKFVLSEQLKVIKKELGLEKDGRKTIIKRFTDRIQSKTIPKTVMEVIDEEINKLKMIEIYSSDFNVIRNYLDWLTVLPWGVRSTDNLDLNRAKRILDANHYGMSDVKTRVLEFIAVSQLKGKTQGKILCFYGPPGVGKTSIARSIAQALDRKYFRFSVGGMINAVEIKGHRRTYVGAMPGKIVQCLKNSKSENPLILIDEIDKIGKGAMEYVGGGADPASALLELLDPEQNENFMDFYMDVPIDLSKVLFICTANTIDTIPLALRDRMELIEMAGYVGEEKVAIAEQYLVPKAIAESGLSEYRVQFDRSTLIRLNERYCAESGVRTLQRLIEKIVRKVAFKIVNTKDVSNKPIHLSAENVQDYLGKATNPLERLYLENTPPGVVMGLGYTQMGGTIIYIESTTLKQQHRLNTHDRLHLTGNLGKVMKESAEIALTVARNTMPNSNFLETNKIHVHIPSGAQPKDGPSAGITIVAALHSLALNRAVRSNLAMTGELSLNGKVLPVGGIKEKTIAAKRLGVKCIILPAENQHDFNELPKCITDGMEVHFVKHYSEVFPIIFEEPKIL